MFSAVVDTASRDRPHWSSRVLASAPVPCRVDLVQLDPKQGGSVRRGRPARDACTFGQSAVRVGRKYDSITVPLTSAGWDEALRRGIVSSPSAVANGRVSSGAAHVGAVMLSVLSSPAARRTVDLTVFPA